MGVTRRLTPPVRHRGAVHAALASFAATGAASGAFGSAAGGILMGRIAERFGIRSTVMFGSVMIGIGLFISTLGPAWSFYLGHGLFMGLLGNAGLNAPLYVYVSRWFDRRRGTALALISSGQYIAGMAWPTLFEEAIADYGWQATMLGFAVIMLLSIPFFALLLQRGEQIGAACQSRRIDALRQRQARRLKEPLIGVAPLLMVELELRIGAVRCGVIGRGLDKPRIALRAHQAGKLAGNDAARPVNQSLGQDGGRR